MPTIKLLDKSVAELIAAGEVIERPSSVIKELVENSVDSGAKHITIEIKNGGISYMRITDDGCGIAFDEIPTAFLRHATSKIRTGEDLNSIDTMGFRGEALASVAAVAKIEMLTRQQDDELGGSYKAQGGEMTEHERCGCPCGTTIIIRDLFYNTPARLKFLKKDVSEGNFISAVVDRLALSNPHISFRFIRDNKTVRLTSGDGSEHSAIRAVFGRQFADSLVPVDYSFNKIDVTGYVSSPLFCRASRSMQTFFVNSRYIKNTTCMAALEEAYRNSMMVGKFPACVLNIKIAPDEVDVNVHPAKTEIRFAHEKPVFDAVYLAVKNALVNCANDKRQIELESRQKKSSYTSIQNYYDKNPQVTKVEQQSLNTAVRPESTDSGNISIQTVYGENPIRQTAFNSPRAEYNAGKHDEKSKADILIADKAESEERKTDLKNPAPENTSLQDEIPLPTEPPVETQPAQSAQAQTEYRDSSDSGFKYISNSRAVRVREIVPEQPEAEKEIRVIGEFAATYIVCEADDELILIDKHAAHERIRFEKLKSEFYSSSQLLIDKTELRLSAQEYNALSEYYSYVEQLGVELVFEDDCTVLITAMPSVITKCTPQEMVCEIAQRLINHSTEQSGALFDDMLHTMACRSAIKANDRNDITELEALARRVYNDESIRFCPHGRPVMTALKKSRIEHFFSRTG